MELTQNEIELILELIREELALRADPDDCDELVDLLQKLEKK